MDNNHPNQDEKKASRSNQNTDNQNGTNKSLAGASLREQVLGSIRERNNDLPNPTKGQENNEKTEPRKQQEHREEPTSQEAEVSRENTYHSETASRLKHPSKESSEVTMSESRRRQSKRQKENTMVRKIVAVVVVALIVTVTILGFSFYRYWKSALKPYNPKDSKLVQVEIKIGTSNKGIGAILEENKIIKSGLVFNYFVKTNNLTDFKGGFYQMAPDMELEQIGRLLQQGGTDQPLELADARITIPEGFSIEQIANLFAEKTKVSKEEFLAVITDEKFFNTLYDKYPNLLSSVKDGKDVRYRLEGYLFPATYNYYEETTIEEIVTQMVDKTNTILAPKMEDISAKNYTVQQLLTLASLVEKEGVEEGDRRNIAQVFLNRIETDMPLQSDISILYAMEEHKVHLSNKDTQVDSPYNLYINKGYGPGPFNNPSEQAINAVLNPEDNDFIYFLADVDTGKVYFAKTYEEHLKLKEEYIDSKN